MEREPLLAKQKIPHTTNKDSTPILPRLFTILAALKASKLPSSKQLINLLQSILHSDLLDSTPEGTIFQPTYGTGRIGTGKLTKEGENVRTSIKEVLEAVLGLIQERLEDDTVQELLWHLKQSEIKVETSPPLNLPSQTGVESPTDSIQTIMLLFITSPQLRLLVVEATTLLRDVFTDVLATRGEAGRVGVEIVEKVADKIIGDDRDLKGKMKEVPEDFLSEERKPKSTEEMRDAFADRFTKILHDIQSNQQYKSSILSLLRYIKIYIARLTPNLPSISVETPSSTSTTRLFANFLEPFTGGPESLSPLLNSIDRLFQRKEAEENRLLAVYNQVNQFIELTLIKEGFLGSSAFNRQLSTIYDSLSALSTTDVQLKSDIQTFFSQLFVAVELLVQDSYIHEVGEACSSLLLASESWFAMAAKIAVGQHSVWGDVLEWIIPNLGRVLRDLPLPRSDSLDLALDAPPFLSTSFIPDKVTFNTHTSLTLLPSTSTTPLLSPDIYSSTTTVGLSGLRAETLGIGYFLRWKGPCGISIVDSGLLDLGFGRGELGGLDISLELSKTSEDEFESSLFHLNTSKLSIDRFTLNSHLSNHPIINFFLLPIIRSSIKYELEILLNERISSLVERIGEIGWEVKEVARVEGGGILGWSKGLWRVIVEESTNFSHNDTPYSDEDEDEDDDEPEEETPEITLSSKGLIIDLPDSEGTLGIGSEGLVIESGTAVTPLARLSVPQAFKKEYQETLKEGRKRQKVLKEDLEEIAEGIGGFKEVVRKKMKKEGWRSKGFDW